MPSIHDPIFNLAPQPRFPWGRSPFHARGLVFRDEVLRADATLDARAREVIKRSLDPALAAYLAQRFSPLDWYDLEPLTYYAAAVARARGIAPSQYVREISAVHVQQALGGFSGVVLRFLSTETVATWITRASSWYHDFGGVEARPSGPRQVRGVRWGVPLFFVRHWAFTATYFSEAVLQRTGAKAARAHVLEAEADGLRDGYPLFRVGFELTWAEG